MRTLDARTAITAGAVESGLLSYTEVQLKNLQAKLAGAVQQPGLPGYNDDRMVFMHTYQHYPQAIIHCVVETDVTAALAFAQDCGLKVTVRSGGHSTAGYSVNDQIVIDMSGIDHVLIDRGARVARVGAGANFRKLNLMLDAAGLHVPGGGCETVCVAGYMQGGGYGFTSRLFGMNCDKARAVTMALADGRIVRASDDAEQELFWAVRGGTGCQFGVLLEIEYDLVELSALFGFGLKWELGSAAGNAAAAEALAAFQRGFTIGGPERLGAQALLINVPDANHPDGQVPHLLIRGVYDGSEAECRSALAPLTRLMQDEDAQFDIHRHGRYLELNEILLQTVDPPGLDLPTVSMNTKPLVDGRIVQNLHGPEVWARVVRLFLDAPDKTCFIAHEAYGGAINDVAADATAFVHRSDSLDIFAWAFWTFDDIEPDAVAWLDRFGEIAGVMSGGRRYQNYPRRGNPDFEEQYFGANLPRLQRAKRIYDPGNLFAFEQSITAAAEKKSTEADG